MKKYPTEYEKRKLFYERRIKDDSNRNPLQLPYELRNKISQAEYKKIKEAFYIESTTDIQNQFYTLNRQQLVRLLRSLGIVSKTVHLYEHFAQFDSRTIGWEQFLQVYLNVRTQKGSYNELNHALNELNKEYRGDWEYLQEDLMTIGDILTEEQLNIFYKDIIGKRPLNEQTMLNVLLGYK